MAYQQELIDDRLVAGSSLSRSRVTDRPRSPTVFGVPPTWPAEEFRAYLRALMDMAGIADYAELSRLADVSQTQMSLWRRGLAQPKQESLSKIASVLGVAPVKLWYQAGLISMDDLNMADAPDLRVLPPEIRELIELLIASWEDSRLGPEGRDFMRRSLAAYIAGLRAEWLPEQRPSGRRRAG